MTTNGDTERYANHLGSYGKGLPHDNLGLPIDSAFQQMIKASKTGLASDFDAIPLGGTRKLTNPQAGWSFALFGRDPQAFSISPAPRFDSAREACEIVENYWMALLRDVPFESFPNNPIAQAAVEDFNRMSDCNLNLPITTQNLFRAKVPGATNGPFLSQFFFSELPFGANFIDLRTDVPKAGEDFMTSWDEYLAIQNGQSATRNVTFVPGRRYMVCGRDLAHWVHIDVLFQAYFQALLRLFAMQAPLKSSLPYQSSGASYVNQIGFGTYGDPFFASILGAVASEALKAAWYQKWNHFRIRPEEFGSRIDRTKLGFANFPIHPEALNSSALPRVFAKYSSYLLPQAFPEGCPTHAAYAAGHATVAAACTTLLKAFFQEDYPFPDPLVPSADGTTLLPYQGNFTIGGELNKLAANVAYGRNIAGVHWRSDAEASFVLGEQVAIGVLRQIKRFLREPVAQFTFVGFDGNVKTVS